MNWEELSKIKNPGAPPGLSREKDRHEYYRWNRPEEARDVRNFIKEKYGIEAKVGHGTGTAWTWLYVKLKGNVDAVKEHEIMEGVEHFTGRDRLGENANVSMESPDRVYPKEPWMR
jgi:hypothetical protein